MGLAFSPNEVCVPVPETGAPGWYGGAPLALGGRLGVHHFSRLRLLSASSERIWVMAISLSLSRRSGWDSP